MSFKNTLISVAVASLLIGCGSSSSDNKNPNVQNPTGNETLKAIDLFNKAQTSFSKQVDQFAQKGYYEMGDSRIVTLSGNDKFVITGNKWHNGLSILNLNSKDVKFTPFSALKDAGHNKPDATSGATEAVINKVKIVNSSVYVNIPKTKNSKTKIPGLYRVDINENGSFNLENEQIKSSKRTPESESYKNFITSKDASKIIAYDGANIVSFDKDLKELESKEIKLMAFDFSDDKLVAIYKDGTRVYISVNDMDKLLDFKKDIELNFEPTFMKTLTNNKVITIEENDKKALKISMIDINSKKIVTNEIKEIIGTRYSYDISDDGKFLAIASYNSIRIVALYSGKPEVLKTINTQRTGAVDFISNNKLAYNDGSNDIVVVDLKEGKSLTKEDLISMKLEKLTSVDLNNGLPFSEVRKDMDFSKKKLFDSIDVSYEPTGLLTNYLNVDGKFIQPEKTVSGKLKIKGAVDGKVGFREVDLTLIGKDIKDTIVFDNEKVLNTVTIGQNKVILATNKGFRTYKVENDTLTKVGDLIVVEGIDELASPGAFNPTQIHKINDTTIIGLGKKYTGSTIKMKSRRGEFEEKLYESKIFKATVKADGTVNKQVDFIDVGNTDITEIDVSADKKTLAVLFSPSPKYIDDSKNAGYKKSNNTFTSALIYDLENNVIKTNKFEVKRDCSDFNDRENCKDRSVEDVISLNSDGSKLLISEGHHGILKLYKNDGTLIDDAPNATGELNHMPAHYIIGDKIIGFPLKGSKFYAIDITGNSIDTLMSYDYPSGKAWANKGTLFGNELHIPNSNRYIGGNPSVIKYNIDTNTINESIYKIYNTEVGLSDVDYLGNSVILTGRRIAGRGSSVNTDSVYLNVQNKK